MSAPTLQTERITNLDSVRGFATLGILIMNALMFGLLPPAYQNLDAIGSENILDWVFGVAGEILIDQKTMALFSMLFGAGIVLFADRSEARGKKPLRLSLWRNLLLAGIGFLHAMLWEGDILIVYGSCAPVLLLLRKKSNRFLIAAGAGLFILTVALGVATQLAVNDGSVVLGDFWSGTESMGDEVGFWFITDVLCRALGAMLIGVALYRSGFIAGKSGTATYRKAASWGLSIGVPLATAGVIIQAIAGYDSNVAIVGQIPNTIATVPIALAYISLIAIWDRKPVNGFHLRMRSVGQMALTNYLTQTIIGVTIFATIFNKGDLNRSGIVVFILCVWGIQLAWSKPWLTHFKFGPAEWIWRCVTYRTIQPLRRVKKTTTDSKPVGQKDPEEL